MSRINRIQRMGSLCFQKYKYLNGRAKSFCQVLSFPLYPETFERKETFYCITSKRPTLKGLCKFPEIPDTHKQLDAQEFKYAMSHLIFFLIAD